MKSHTSTLSRLVPIFIAGLTILGILIAGCSVITLTEVTEEQETIWPTDGWSMSTPEEQGMNSALLEQMMHVIDENQVPIDSVVVVRHGHIVFEAYRNNYDEVSTHHLQSVTKSFTSTLIGIALQQGFIESVDQLLLDFYPERTIGNPDPRKDQITLEHLLTMSPGMDWHELDYPYTDPRNSLGQMWVSRDVIQHVLDHPMVREPGAAWSYNSGTSILLGDIVEQASGTDTVPFARQYLFDPLGFGATYLAKTPDGTHYHTDGGLYMIPRDMARLGYLMLHDGIWDGERILPEGWVEQATSNHYQAFSNHGYGYQWWTIEGTDIYYASGHYDQAIYVAPEADMVVVFTADVPDEAIHPLEGFLFHYILAACTDLPEGYIDNQYSGYGFSFDYGREYFVTHEPVPGTNELTEQSGTAQFSFINYPIEIFTVMWHDGFAGMDAEETLASASELLGGQSSISINWGERAELSMGDRTIPLQSVTGETEGFFFNALIGVWMCDASEQAFVFTFVSDATEPLEDLISRLGDLLESFSCLEGE
jgi:CubicO group peptidase (beta-lactamase class C family)